MCLIQKFLITLIKINHNMKKKFLLQDSAGQIISAVESDQLDKAIKYFSIIKNLSPNTLLSVFKVVEIVI